MTRRTVDEDTQARPGGGWPARWAPRLGGWVGIVFGVVTVLAGASVLFGLRDAGYPVFRPLLIFNTVMGPLYILAGALILARRPTGRLSAGLIGLVNLAVLVAIALVRDAVAQESLGAMTARAAVWLIIYAALSAVPTRRIRDPV